MIYQFDKIETKFTFTFKQDVNKKTVEIETEITLQDYLLLKEQAFLSFTKTRYVIENWEIDFFKSEGEIYFVQAEIELPENCKKPKRIHPLVKENLLHIVKRGDGRFSSKKLADVKYAKKILQNLKMEKMR